MIICCLDCLLSSANPAAAHCQVTLVCHLNSLYQSTSATFLYLLKVSQAQFDFKKVLLLTLLLKK